ncbi:hypothetical protein PV783_13535 [Chitinophaga sp. CC14]|uniref:hypothetical protein n=1 Tax=Chitinophaga sp. CC14 TaxID=3029199 RepID=UPI003B7B6A9E
MGKMPLIDEDRLQELLLKYYCGSQTAAEGEEIESYCQIVPELRLILQRLDDKELVQEHISDLRAAEKKLIWKTMQAKLREKPHR